MSEWISVEDRLPETGKKVLAYFEYKATGFGRRICANYTPRWTCESDAEADTYDEYNDDDDTYYLMEGWWEQVENWEEYSCCYVTEEITHWMPLPEPPELERIDK